jgi:hypothetical protein
MVSPQVEDGGDGLQIWRAAANILNKQSWTGGLKEQYVTPGCAAGQGLHVIKNWVMSVIPAKSYPYYVLVIVPGQRSSEWQCMEGQKAIFQCFNWYLPAKGVNPNRKS